MAMEKCQDESDINAEEFLWDLEWQIIRIKRTAYALKERLPDHLDNTQNTCEFRNHIKRVASMASSIENAMEQEKLEQAAIGINKMVKDFRESMPEDSSLFEMKYAKSYFEM